MPKVMLEGYKCERCGHEWLPRSKIDEPPTICPKCKSPYWDKPRISTTGTKITGQKIKRHRVKEGASITNER